MRKAVNYADINSFLVLVEEGSFTNAAEKLQCSRSQVSKQLSQLEANLGVSLLVRTTRTQHLTSSGQVFYAQCKRAFVGIDKAIDNTIEATSRLSGEIKINCVGGFIGENIVGPLVADFMQQHPEVTVNLDFSSRRVDLIAGEFDFVFRMGELTDSALIARKLMDLTIGTYASPEYIELYGKPEHPKNLITHKCITGSMKTWMFTNTQTLETQEVNIKGDLTCKNGRVMLCSAIRGNGIIRIPEIYCTTEINEGKLLPVFDHWQPRPSPLYLVYLQDKHPPSRVTAFKEFALNNFAHYATC